MHQRTIEPVPTALVVEGGAMRSAFSAGLLDAFLERGFDPFDTCIGVSAGACNLAAYLANCQGLALKLYLEFAKRRKITDVTHLLSGRPLFDLDWLSGALDGELAAKLALNGGGERLRVGVTSVSTGQAEYLGVENGEIGLLLRASTALPLLYKEFPRIAGQPLADGGIADALPVFKAFASGARTVMLVRARPSQYRKKDTPIHRLMRWRMRAYPALVSTMAKRVPLYNDTLNNLANPPQNTAILEICPPSDLVMARFTGSAGVVLRAYESGREVAVDVIRHWQLLLAGSHEPVATTQPNGVTVTALIGNRIVT